MGTGSSHYSSLFSQGQKGRSPKQHPDPRLQHPPITCVTDSSLLQDGEFAVVTTIAQHNTKTFDAPIHSMWRELCLRIDFFFQISKSESYKERVFQKKIATEWPGLHIWYWCFYMFSFKFCTNKLARHIPFTKPSKSSCTLFAVVMIIKVVFKVISLTQKTQRSTINHCRTNYAITAWHQWRKPSRSEHRS